MNPIRIGSDEFALVPWHSIAEFESPEAAREALRGSGQESMLADPRLRVLRLDRDNRPAPEKVEFTPASRPMEVARKIRAKVRIVEVLGSHDGRVFINERHDRGPAKNVQYVDLTAEVTTDPADASIPPGLKLVWEWEDPEDAVDGSVRADAAPILSGENRGECDHPAPRFSALTGYPLTASGPSACETAVENRKGRVRFHGTNVGGDNFRVRVRFAPHGEVETDGEDATGRLTMWKRIRVEVHHMKGAHPLPVDEVARHFEKAYVQMEFVPAKKPAPAKPFLSRSYRTLNDVSTKYIDRIAEHAGKPGWFLLLSALEATEDMRKKEDSRIVYSGPADLEAVSLEISGKHYEQLVIRGAKIDDEPVSVALFRDGKSVTFYVEAMDRSKGDVYLILKPHSYVPRFEPEDGEIGADGQGIYRHIRHYWPGGFGFSGRIEKVEVRAGGGRAPAGRSEFVKIGRRAYFAGRTTIFTHHPAFRAWDGSARAEVVQTIVHELTHAFGLPHKCGKYDYRASSPQSCAMNYEGMWLFAPGTEILERFVTPSRGNDLCAEHLRAIRDIHLEDNPALWKW